MGAIATIDLGKIRFKWRGAYNAATAYTPDDVVEFQGSSYVCLSNATGQTPAVGSTFWELMALGGNPANIMTTQGDLLLRGSAGLERLARGSDQQFLMMNGTNVQWRNSPDVRIVQRFNFQGASGQWETDASWRVPPDLSHNFTPRRSDTRIRYHWNWQVYWQSGAHSILHMRFLRNGSVIRNFNSSAQYNEQPVHFIHDETSWGAGVTHNVQLQARDYNHNGNAANFHGTTYWEGGGGNAFVPPIVTIEEYIPAS